MPPKVIGPYRILETIGCGGVGTVYRAIDRRNGEALALKLLSSGPALDPRAARRLAREFEALADLSHPNVVRVFDTGVFQGYPYLTMELVEGLTLKQYLSLAGSKTPNRIAPIPVQDDDSSSEDTGDWPAPFSLDDLAEESPSEEGYFSKGPAELRAFADAADEPDTSMSGQDFELPYPIPHDPDSDEETTQPDLAKAPDFNQINQPERMGRLKDCLLQLCQALSYVHGRGLVHRDLKPTNVMVDEDHQVRLMDFGLAKYIADDGAVTSNGKRVGTFRYMAPEQILGEPVDPRCDLYSLGVILYELIAGRSPFDAKTPYELWQKVLETEPAPLLSINARADVQLVRVAHRLIRKEPSDRYQTAEEVYEALSE